MRAICAIVLLLAACGDDTTVAFGADMTFPPGMPYPCELNHTCCCAPPTIASDCVTAVRGQSCSADQQCNLAGEHGGMCSCTAGVWACRYPFTDFAIPRYQDMAGHD